MEKFLENLADLILEETKRTDCTYTRFADNCGISRNEIEDIIRRNKKDIKMSTVKKIYENSNISKADIFDFSDNEIFEKMLKQYVFTNGLIEYHLYNF